MSPKKLRPSATDAAIASMRKDGLLMGGDHASLTVERIPTGIPELDTILGGGFPRRRISVLSGMWSSGKSFVLQLTMKAALARGLSVVYIDTEQTYDPEWWAQVGLPLDGINVSQPSSGEAAAKVAIAAAQAGVDIIALDSLAAIYPAKVLEEDFDKKFMGYRAQLINKLLEAFIATKSRAAFICTNQLRDNFSNTPGPQINMPGGKGVLHYSSIITRMHREGWIEEQGRRVGFNMRIQCAKSKVGTPFGECLLPFRFRGEIDMLAMLVDRAVEHGYIIQNGPWFKMALAEEEPLQSQGRNAIIQELRDRPALAERLRGMMGES